MTLYKYLNQGQTLNAASARREYLNGREHLVVPMTMIVPGVLNGSKGKLFYPKEEITRDPKSWDGVVITHNHPSRNGVNISANDLHPQAAERIGVVRNPSAKDKLRAEAWIDVQKADAIDPRILNAVRKGQAMEISTGLYTDNEKSAGDWKGKPYDYIARNYRPDHLAILPDQRGACSLQDGCGLGVNQMTLNTEVLAEEYVVNANPEGHNQYSHGSPAAHKVLTSHNWFHVGGNQYEHQDALGHKIIILGHENAGRSRRRLVWSHSRSGSQDIHGQGVDQLDYHLGQESKRRKIIGNDSSLALIGGKKKRKQIAGTGEEVENSNPEGHNQYTTKKIPNGVIGVEHHVFHGETHIGTISEYRGHVPPRPGSRLSSGKMRNMFSARTITPNPTGRHVRSGHYRDKRSAIDHIIMEHERFINQKPPISNDSSLALIGGKKKRKQIEAGTGGEVENAEWITYNDRWPAKRRHELDRKDFAGPDESFPISSQKDVNSAVRLRGHAENPEAVLSKIKRIAKRKGLSVPKSVENEESMKKRRVNNAMSIKDHEQAAKRLSAHAKAITEKVGSNLTTVTPHAEAAYEAAKERDSDEAVKHHIRAVSHHVEAARDCCDHLAMNAEGDDEEHEDEEYTREEHDNHLMAAKAHADAAEAHHRVAALKRHDEDEEDEEEEEEEDAYGDEDTDEDEELEDRVSANSNPEGHNQYTNASHLATKLSKNAEKQSANAHASAAKTGVPDTAALKLAYHAHDAALGAHLEARKLAHTDKQVSKHDNAIENHRAAMALHMGGETYAHPHPTKNQSQCPCGGTPETCTCSRSTNNEEGGMPTTMTREEWLASAPPDVVATLNFGMEEMQRQKNEIIGKLTANFSAEEKPKAVEFFNAKSIDELRMIERTASMMTANVQAQAQQVIQNQRLVMGPSAIPAIVNSTGTTREEQQKRDQATINAMRPGNIQRQLNDDFKKLGEKTYAGQN